MRQIKSVHAAAQRRGRMTPEAIAELAPTGRLRVGLNVANFLLVSGRTPEGEPDGVVPTLAQYLAEWAGLALELRLYDTPGDLADGAAAGEWDVGFIGVEPQRQAELDFTEPYAEIEVTALVHEESIWQACSQLDTPGVRIAAAARAAYELWLTANLRHAQVVTAEGIDGSLRLFFDKELDSLSGLRPRLEADAAQHEGLRVLPDRFTTVRQAACTPKGRPLALEAVSGFGWEALASGEIARLIREFGMERWLTPP